MAIENIVSRPTGFRHAMGRHGARSVPHDQETLRQFRAVSVSRLASQPYVIVDTVKVFRLAAPAAQDIAMQRKTIPDYMIWEEGKEYAGPQAATAELHNKLAEARTKNADADRLALSVEESHLPEPASPGEPAGEASAPTSGATAELYNKLAEARTKNAELIKMVARIPALEAELQSLKSLAPTIAERDVVITVPGFGDIALVVDYLWQRDAVLVLGTLRSKKRATAAPKPAEGQVRVTFKARIGAMAYDLISFADLRFPVGDLDVQTFMIAKAESVP